MSPGRFTRAPINTTGQYFYAYTMNWTGFDPDGRLDHFLYKVDPTIDTAATRMPERGRPAPTFTRRESRA